MDHRSDEAHRHPVLRRYVETTGHLGHVLDDFRASYVLRYSAHGVRRPGWHDVTVEVPGGRGYRVRARSGYFVVK